MHILHLLLTHIKKENNKIRKEVEYLIKDMVKEYEKKVKETYTACAMKSVVLNE